MLKKILKKKFSPNTKIRSYQDYQEALQDSTQGAYEDEELVNVVLEKTKRLKTQLGHTYFREIDFKTANLLLSILYLRKKQINLIDLGGACGSHYFEVRKLLPPDVSLTWAVVETPKMVSKAKELTNNELHFYDKLSEATRQIGKIDLFHTSGTLQCVANPLGYVKEIIGSGARYLLFNRMGFILTNEPITILHESYVFEHGIGQLPDNRNGKIIRFPYTYLSKKQFDELIDASHYQLLMEFSDDSGVSPINNEPIIGKGLLYELKY